MRNHSRLLMFTCALLAAALMAGGCDKVRDPQEPAKPGPTGPATDAKVAGPEAPSGPPPAIACDAPEHDFGKVSQGEEAVHTFSLKNKGQGVLKIERARGG